MAKNMSPAFSGHHTQPRQPPLRAAASAKSRPAVKPPARRSGHGLAALLLAAVTLAGAVWWYWSYSATPHLDPLDSLLEQMDAAANGNAVPTHAYGGALSVAYGNGRMNVTAETLPSKACVQVGWRLAKEGTIIVNGVLPARLSAAKLAELCGLRDGGATLTWMPEGEQGQ